MEQGSKTIIAIHEPLAKAQLGEVVHETVEGPLNKLLDAEADALCDAQWNQGFVERTGLVRAAEPRGRGRNCAAEVPQTPEATFRVFDHRTPKKRRECAIEESLMEMYLAGVSVSRVEDISRALSAPRVSAGMLSRLNQQIHKKVEEWRNQPLEDSYAYVFLDGLVMKRTRAKEVRNVSILTAFGGRGGIDGDLPGRRPSAAWRGQPSAVAGTPHGADRIVDSNANVAPCGPTSIPQVRTRFT